jgi:sphingomyelin phosphodiesterase acid-like 3
LFSNQAEGKNIDTTASNELSWFHQELEKATKKHQRVLIAMHIPMGIDVYTSLFNPFRIVEFWKSSYAQQFLADIQNFSSVIMGVFPGHLHADVFQIYRTNGEAIPFTGTPSISPIFGNNPAFKIYSYSTKSLRLVDFVTYYYSLNGNKQWEKEYDFDEVYRLKQSDPNIVSGMNLLKPLGELAEKYKIYYSVNTNSQPITKYNKWFNYWCAVHSLTVNEYRKCLHEKKEN